MGSYTVTIGGGGAGNNYGPTGQDGQNGSNSYVGSNFTAVGGGGGRGNGDPGTAASGGSGGGYLLPGGVPTNQNFPGSGLQPSQSGDSGTYGYGNRGGYVTATYSGSGGGGAGGAAPNSGSYNGSGGAGKYYDIGGSNTYYAAGGGAYGSGSDAAANTGNGANGTKNAGSGIVIIRYALPAPITFTYNGTAWKKPAGTLGPTGPSGPTGNGVNDVPRITSRLGNVSNTSGGTITLTGTDFVSGCTVYIGTTAATTTTVDSSTQVTAVIPSGIASGTYFIYIYNPDGSSGFLPNGLTIT